METLKKMVAAVRKLKSIAIREIEYMMGVLQCLVLITIIDEFCYVKLTNKREWVKFILARKD